MASESSIIIPPEIMTDILYRLPAKSLGRFRSVSKEWLSLISDPEFIKTHQKIINRTHLIFNTCSYDSLYSVPFHHHEVVLAQTTVIIKSYDVDFTLNGSFNGLVLLSTSDFEGLHTLMIVNPTTKEFVELPDSGYEVVDEIFKIKIMYGFGYDSVNDDYKVVTISYLHNNYQFPPFPLDNICVHVYSLKTNTWKRVIDSPYDHTYSDSSSVFVSGLLHWIASKNGSPVLAAFSLTNEKFSEMPSPNSFNDVDIMSKSDCKLVVLGEKLAIFLEVEGEVWLMKEYDVKESWTKILIHGFHEISMVEPMIFFENGRIILVSHDLTLVYDVEERRFCISKDNSQIMKVLNVKGTYIESLVDPSFHKTD